MEDKPAKKSSKGIVECATAARAQRAPERDFTKRSEKNVRFVRFYPPPPSRLLYEVERLVCVCGGRRCWQAARECNGVRLSRMPARQTLYHTLVLVCGRASHRDASQNGGEFLATSGELHWDAQPATLDNPKIWDAPGISQGAVPRWGRVFGYLWGATRIAGETPAGMHPSHRPYSRSLGRFA